MSGILCYIEQFLTSAACLALYTEQYKKYIMYRRQKDEQVRSASGLKKKKKRQHSIGFQRFGCKGKYEAMKKALCARKARLKKAAAERKRDKTLIPQ